MPKSARDMSSHQGTAPLRPPEPTSRRSPFHNHLRPGAQVGWAAYFRFGSSAIHFEKSMHHVWTRVTLVIAKRHRRSRGYGW
ncbi:hypothetical protein Pd630_LPD16115 (plasmid) [Rhodococcus opacus PD630]|nr:hypothetical protein Pd630_LPD16115 [Rhodococcus opacus PD630]UDH01282.1 hypothetical protein K2Z90_007753 [Rhodococcus opacus PD630]